MFCSIKLWLYEVTLCNFMAIRDSEVNFSHGPPELRSVCQVRRVLLALFLMLQTIAKDGQGNEMWKAKATMAWMKGTKSLKEAKRSANRNDDGPARN